MFLRGRDQEYKRNNKHSNNSNLNKNIENSFGFLDDISSHTNIIGNL